MLPQNVTIPQDLRTPPTPGPTRLLVTDQVVLCACPAKKHEGGFCFARAPTPLFGSVRRGNTQQLRLRTGVSLGLQLGHVFDAMISAFRVSIMALLWNVCLYTLRMLGLAVLHRNLRHLLICTLFHCRENWHPRVGAQRAISENGACASSEIKLPSEPIATIPSNALHHDPDLLHGANAAPSTTEDMASDEDFARVKSRWMCCCLAKRPALSNLAPNGFNKEGHAPNDRPVLTFFTHCHTPPTQKLHCPPRS